MLYYTCNTIVIQRLKYYQVLQLKNIMRKIINISTSEEMSKKIDQAVKEYNFTSKSEFFIYLFRKWEEEKELEELQKSVKEAKQDKLKELNFFNS